jgi:uncharacterized phage protein gp47/JayE
MANSFLKDFDMIFEEIKTDYINQGVAADTGSLANIKAACLASALWGIYKSQDWIAKQIFPDTATLENLTKHASIRQITQKTDETKQEFLVRYLEKIRQPAAGGNKYDYERWAMEVDGVKSAKTIPLIYGRGTVGIIILATDGVPSSELLQNVYDYISDLHPVTAKELYIEPAEILSVDVDMQIIGSEADLSEIQSNIENYLNGFTFQQTLFLVQLIAIATEYDSVNDAVISAPTMNIVPYTQEIIRAGNVNIHT